MADVVTKRAIRIGTCLLALACAAQVGAATTSWRTELARGGEQGFGGSYSFGEIQPTRDGFWLIGSSFGPNWVARHARDGTRVGLQRFDARAGFASADSRGELTVRYGPGDYGLVDYLDDCVVARGDAGAPRSVLSVDNGAPDGDGGVIEAGMVTGLDIRSTDLYRVQRDCRKAALPAIGRDEIVGLRNDPAAAAAYVLARNADKTGVEIVRIDRDAVRWRVALPDVPARDFAVELGDADATGVGVSWIDRDSSPYRNYLARVTVDGRLAWKRLVEGSATYLVAWRPAPLLAHFQSGLARQFEGLDRDTGETTFVAPAALAMHSLGRVPTARVDNGWRIRGYAGDSGPAAVLDVDPTGSSSVRWRATGDFHRASAELADGSLVVSRPRGFYGGDWSLVAPDETQGQGRVLGDAGRAPLARLPQVLVTGPDGAALAGYHEESRAFVARVEPDGRLAWTTDLPATDTFGGVRIVAAAMDATRACVLTENISSNRMRCFEARTGAPSFESELGGRSSNWRVGSFVDGMHVIDASDFVGPDGRNERLRLRVFGPSGGLRLEREIPVAHPYDRLSELGPSGDLLALAFDNVRVIAPDGTLRWSIDASVDQATRLAPDGGAMLVDADYDDGEVITEVRRIGSDGRERWRRTLGDVIVTPLGPDWLLRDGGRLRRIADADAGELWAVPRPAPRSLRATAADGSAFLDGAAWYDGHTGARVGSIADVPDAFATVLYRIGADGKLHRLAAQVDARTSVVALERFARDDAAGPRARRAASGYWSAPAVPGQGIALVVDSRSGAVDGRWLTFRGSNETRIDEQRWYRLAGRAAAEGDSIALAIEAPQPSGFDGGAVAWRTVGTASWRMRECTRVELEFRVADDELERSGLLVLERRGGDVDCEAPVGPETPIDVDTWRIDGEAGRDIVVAQRRDGAIEAWWPTFVPAGVDAGRPHWLTLAGDGGTLRIDRTLAGRFAFGATRNTLTIGSATVRRSGCDRMAIDYRFDADEVAAPFDGRSGRLLLRRRGRCTQ